MKNNQSGKVLFIAQAAMIAAIYVVLTLIGASLSARHSVTERFRSVFPRH